MAHLTPTRLAEIRGRVAAFIPRSWITEDIAALLEDHARQAAEIERLRAALARTQRQLGAVAMECSRIEQREGR